MSGTGTSTTGTHVGPPPGTGGHRWTRTIAAVVGAVAAIVGLFIGQHVVRSHYNQKIAALKTDRNMMQAQLDTKDEEIAALKKQLKTAEGKECPPQKECEACPDAPECPKAATATVNTRVLAQQLAPLLPACPPATCTCPKPDIKVDFGNGKVLDLTARRNAAPSAPAPRK